MINEIFSSALQVLNPFGQLTQRRFDPDGKAIQEQRANGTLTNYAYNGRDQLSSIEHRLANNTLLDRFDYSYTDGYGGYYDGTGRIRQETDNGGRVHKFGFSQHHYELTNEDHRTSAWVRTSKTGTEISRGRPKARRTRTTASTSTTSCCGRTPRM